MLNFNEKISYLFTSAYNYFNKVECPYCLQGNAKVIDRKYLVTRLFECNFCHLYFRHPIDKVDKSVKFYQNNYFESDHITTDLPNKAELNHLIEINFNPDKNANQLITLFKILISNIESTKIVDYGANWGYTTYQLLKNNFQVQAYEISKPRAFFGIKNLGIDIKVDEKDLETDNDIFFSSHVIEHHPDIKSMIDLGFSLLKENGYFVALSPNGSIEYRRKNPINFHHLWGKVHNNYLNVDFYKSVFKDYTYYIGTTPFNLNLIDQFNKSEGQFIDDLTGFELVVIVKNNKK